MRSPEPEPHGDQLTEDLTTPRGDADWMATQATERPSRQAPAAEPAAEAPSEEEPEPVEEEPAAPKKAARKGRGRASVPSWDEIMFGGGRRD